MSNKVTVAQLIEMLNAMPADAVVSGFSNYKACELEFYNVEHNDIDWANGTDATVNECVLHFDV